MSEAYYNEVDPDAALILRALIADSVIAPGDVDTRSITEVQPDDLRAYSQCHFFAGGGLWSVAARMAGWPDDRPIWTGSCPCQPFSIAGKGGGADDARHLWPDFFRLVSACRPAVVVGEQVAGSAGYGWLDGVRADLAREGYASRGVDIPACAVDAPHIRQRLYWCAVADAESGSGGTRLREDDAQRDGAVVADGDGGLSAVANADLAVGRIGDEQRAGQQPQHDEEPGMGARAADDLGDPSGQGRKGQSDAERVEGASPWRPDVERADRGDGRHDVGQLADAGGWGLRNRGRAAPARASAEIPAEVREQRLRLDGGAAYDGGGRNGSWWADHEWIACHDGKARRTQPGVPLLVDGLSGRVGLWRVAGNAISPVLAAEVIGALKDDLDGSLAA